MLSHLVDTGCPNDEESFMADVSLSAVTPYLLPSGALLGSSLSYGATKGVDVNIPAGRDVFFGPLRCFG
jgi:hypothetical protein